MASKKQAMATYESADWQNPCDYCLLLLRNPAESATTTEDGWTASAKAYREVLLLETALRRRRPKVDSAAFGRRIF